MELRVKPIGKFDITVEGHSHTAQFCESEDGTKFYAMAMEGDPKFCLEVASHEDAVDQVTKMFISYYKMIVSTEKEEENGRANDL